MATHAQVAHAWAHQTGKQRRGHNMSYDGPSLISYSTEIARLVTASSGRTVALLSSDTWSHSTSQHQSYARSATSHMVQFTVPWLNVANPDVHGANHASFVDAAQDAIARAKRARTNGPGLLNRAEDYLVEARIYAGTFNLDFTTPTTRDLEPEIDAIRERAEARAAKNIAAHRAAYHLSQSEARDKWLRGESVPHYLGTDENGCAYIRVKGDTLQTSQGVRVPLADAIKVFRLVYACRNTNQYWERSYSSIDLRAGDFTVDHINPDGSFRAGCHKFAWSEIERVARSLGLIETPADHGGALSQSALITPENHAAH